MNTTGQTLHNSSLTHTWLTNQDRIVLLTTTKHCNDTTQFTIATSGRIQLAFSRLYGQITPILVKCRRFTMLNLLLSSSSIYITSTTTRRRRGKFIGIG